MGAILVIYVMGVLLFGIVCSCLFFEAEDIENVDTFFDGVFYCLLWPLVMLKAFLRFMYKFMTTL